MDVVNYRSLFTLHLRAPDGRDGGVQFLQGWTRSEGQTFVPPGTTLALLRRALIPTRSGKLLVSSFVESLQLIVVTPPQDQRFKFTLDRHEFLSGRLGLKPLGKDDPVDTSSFEALLLPNQLALEPSKTEPPSESLIARTFKTLQEIPSSLESCAQCHGGATVRNRIFGGFHPRKGAAYPQSDPDEVAATTVKMKEASSEWKSYLRLRTAEPAD
jgi:mono/diheme cytochrome c family protein